MRFGELYVAGLGQEESEYIFEVRSLRCCDTETLRRLRPRVAEELLDVIQDLKDDGICGAAFIWVFEVLHGRRCEHDGESFKISSPAN